MTLRVLFIRVLQLCSVVPSRTSQNYEKQIQERHSPASVQKCCFCLPLWDDLHSSLFEKHFTGSPVTTPPLSDDLCFKFETCEFISRADFSSGNF